ncbi:MAG: hypothetical protein WC807_11440 [Hyphomicrobium sp.]|jgi:hypothetical protein
MGRSALLGHVIVSLLWIFCWLPSSSSAAEPELDGLCAMGLAEGKRIRTDCSINWTAPDGKVFCFGNADSREVFLKDPARNIEKAREQFSLSEPPAGADDMGRYAAEDVTKFVEETIKTAADKSAGLFAVNDAMLGQTLTLKFEKVDFVRTLHGYGFFPNIIFTDQDIPEKKYQIDFWVRPRGGKLDIVDVRVYKAPRKEGERWVQITRQPKPWWWIPASEHPGESEVKRGWEIMSALHEHITVERAKGGGVYKIKDDKTGEELAMEFVGIHQPVRKLKEDGRFFACTDFRKAGSKDEYYDIDFWLDAASGTVKVGDVRVHKVPMLEDGNFIQMPRYSFDAKTFDVVP